MCLRNKVAKLNEKFKDYCQNNIEIPKYKKEKSNDAI